MQRLLQLISACIYLSVGITSLMMATKNILARSFLPFHAAASGNSWDSVDDGLQAVILAILRISGLGFLVVGLQLTLFPIVNFFVPLPFVLVISPVLSLTYCFGLFIVNYRLHLQTGAATPWKGSLYAVALIAIGIVISIVENHL